MSKRIAELPRRAFLAFANLTAVDHDVVLVGDTIDLNGSKRERFKLHIPLLCDCTRPRVINPTASPATESAQPETARPIPRIGLAGGHPYKVNKHLLEQAGTLNPIQPATCEFSS